jgi:hypothetical protein
MHGWIGAVIESNYQFLFEKEKFKGNDKATAAANHKIQGPKPHFPLVGFGIMACIEGDLPSGR